MKLTVNVVRILVGVLFIFSGLIKAIDPLGLAYKMQEFFEAWAGNGPMNGTLDWLHRHALVLSVLMNTLEVGLGVALLIGWQKKLVSWLLLLLMIFFLYLTSYVLFSGKIRTCGCFGECIPLTPIQTFTKDVILLILIIFILFQRKYITPIIRGVHLVGILFLSIILVSFLQSNALEHLPIIDCLPFKKGNDILALRQMPADATFDKFDYTFIYQKGGQQKEFTVSNLPDSSWQFVEQRKVLIEKGNGKLPLINDFSLTGLSGIDSTEAVLSQKDKYYLFFIKTMGEANVGWQFQFDRLWRKAKMQNRNIYVVTAQTDSAQHYFNEVNKYNVPVFTSDATAIKTAARCTPTIFLMNGPIVENKWSWEDTDDAIK
jgi:uncharacterized membrane protein YphA (DoxX/SURF4 family)